jgi:RNA-binding protein
MSNGIKPVINIGKDGINTAVLESIDTALEARELIKINVLENAPITSRDAAIEIAGTLKAEPVQVIGKKFVLYRRSTKRPTIEL